METTNEPWLRHPIRQLKVQRALRRMRLQKDMSFVVMPGAMLKPKMARLNVDLSQ